MHIDLKAPGGESPREVQTRLRPLLAEFGGGGNILAVTHKGVIRAVADKGGGAHVDAEASPELRLMYQYTPVGRTYAELFVIAIGRFVQALGERLLNQKGCRVPTELTNGQYQRINLLVAAHHEWTVV